MKSSWLLICCCTIAATGCKKIVQVGTPDTQLETGVIFSGDASATAALAGMYSRAMAVQGSFLNGGNTLYPALSADECTPNLASTFIQQFADDQLSSDNNYITTLYGSAYNAIYNANTILENVKLSSRLTDSTRRRLNGEACLFRALVYHRLAELFGPVPLQTTTNADVNATTARSPVADVYDRVILDLRMADSLLSVNYVTAASSPDQRIRPNKWAAQALLARVLLYRGQWAAAEAMAGHVMGSGMYRLTSPDSSFLADSREAIWQLQPVSPVINSAEGSYFLPADNAISRPMYNISPTLLSAWQAGDKRRTSWVGVKSIAGTNYYYPAKYKVRSGMPYREYNMVLRLGEVYCIRAEARAQLGNTEGAIGDLNQLRGRAGLPALSAADLTQEQVLAAVRQERRVELFAEWGHRWSDLKRSGQLDVVMGALKAHWQAVDALYPLPVSEMQRNPAIVQNAGY